MLPHRIHTGTASASAHQKTGSTAPPALLPDIAANARRMAPRRISSTLHFISKGSRIFARSHSRPAPKTSRLNSVSPKAERAPSTAAAKPPTSFSSGPNTLIQNTTASRAVRCVPSGARRLALLHRASASGRTSSGDCDASQSRATSVASRVLLLSARLARRHQRVPLVLPPVHTASGLSGFTVEAAAKFVKRPVIAKTLDQAGLGIVMHGFG